MPVRLLVFFVCQVVGIHLSGCRDDPGQLTDTDQDDDLPAETSLSIDDPLFTEPTATVAEWITPEWYTCETGKSACGGLPCPENDLWVAINPTDFRDSAVCSACMAVEGPLGVVVVDVIENCADACMDGEIELSRSAFESVGNLDEGRADVTWQLVPCDREGPIRFSYEEDSGAWWTGIQVRNPALPVVGLAVRIDDGGEWQVLEKDGWDHFPLSGDLGEGPFDFRVTAIDGQVLDEENIPYRPGEVVDGTLQFVI